MIVPWILLVVSSFAFRGTEVVTVETSRLKAAPFLASQGATSIVYYKFIPTVQQTQGYDVASISFRLLGANGLACMMVSTIDLPQALVEGLSGCYSDTVIVNVTKSNREFCAPSPDASVPCVYFIGVRTDAGISPSYEITVAVTYTKPEFRHLFFTRETVDHLRPEQRFIFQPQQGLQQGGSFSEISFSCSITPSMSASTELRISTEDFPSNGYQIDVYRVQSPNLSIVFTKPLLAKLIGNYGKNITFYMTLVAPSVPDEGEMSLYESSPLFTMHTRLIGDSGLPVSPPTPYPTSYSVVDIPLDQDPNESAAFLWVYVARLLAVTTLFLLLVCLCNTMKYLCKSKETRKNEAIADLLKHSEDSINDEWSRAAQETEMADLR